MSDWDESEHPRDRRGRFTEGVERWLRLAGERLEGRGTGIGRVEGRDARGELDYTSLRERIPYVNDRNPVHGDRALEDIYRAQGWDGPPRVVDQAEMDRLVGSGWSEMWRSVSANAQTGQSAEQVAEDHRTGPVYAGWGGQANGMYALPDWRAEVAQHFGDHMLRMALSPDARTIDSEQLREMMEAEKLTNRHGGWPADSPDLRYAVLSDPGRYAAALGYDAILIRQVRLLGGVEQPYGRETEVVILNRTALAIQGADGG